MRLKNKCFTVCTEQSIPAIKLNKISRHRTLLQKSGNSGCSHNCSCTFPALFIFRLKLRNVEYATACVNTRQTQKTKASLLSGADISNCFVSMFESWNASNPSFTIFIIRFLPLGKKHWPYQNYS